MSPPKPSYDLDHIAGGGDGGGRGINGTKNRVVSLSIK